MPLTTVLKDNPEERQTAKALTPRLHQALCQHPALGRKNTDHYLSWFPLMICYYQTDHLPHTRNSARGFNLQPYS